MQFKSLLLAGLVATGMVSLSVFTACDDDEVAPNTVVVDHSGVYKGSNQVTAMGINVGTVSDYNVTLSPTGTGDYNVKFDAFKLDLQSPPAPMKEVSVTELKISNVKGLLQADGSYSINGIITGKVQMNIGRGMTEYEVKSGVLTGTLRDKALELVATFTPGTMPAPLVYTFKGQR